MGQETYDQKVLPQMIDIVKRSFRTFHLSGESVEQSPEYDAFYGHWGQKPKPILASAEQGQLGVMGLDFMLDEDLKVWLIEVNANCNLSHTLSSDVDMRNKRQLAQDVFSLVIDPLVSGATPDPGMLQRVL
eukprot:TRINITY_DN13913_c0_g1_i3.p1 TRINITY_DN13913_c0_g1~~TRINITY_DN13913_c0_g1_i3.p1  ORF type:complete len:131 (+),score=31.34 TRINITY_DN13913_c0_g1_i3:250-642(+)